MEANYEKEARQVCAAIKKMAENENTLNNFESYLSFHFKEWLEKLDCSLLDLFKGLVSPIPLLVVLASDLHGHEKLYFCHCDKVLIVS